MAKTSQDLPGSLPRRVSGTLNVRLGYVVLGKSPRSLPGSQGYTSVNYPLFIMEKGGLYGMANVCALTSAFKFYYALVPS